MKQRKSILCKAKERFLSSTLVDTFHKVKDKKRLLLYAALYDFLFVISLIGANILLAMFSPDVSGMNMNAGQSVALLLLTIIAYLLALLLLHSFFTYLALGMIKKAFFKHKIRFKELGCFFNINSAVLSISFVLILIFSTVFVMGVEIDALVLVRNVIFALLGVMTYISTNTAYSLFLQGVTDAKEVLKSTLWLMFGGPRRYIGLAAFTLVAFSVMLGAYYALDFVVLKILGSAMIDDAVMMGYQIANTAILSALMFGLAEFNRVYFFNIVSRSNAKLPKRL